MSVLLKYYHDEGTHNLVSPGIIAPLVYKLVTPKSVVDVGCGLGNFLYSFKQLGVKPVLGIDGSWINHGLLEKYLSKEEFMEADLENLGQLNYRFDLAICLEVAEHLAEASADNFIKSLVSLSDVVLFSAAIPHQGGQNHLNEQWPSYWAEKFGNYGYNFNDLLRPVLWGNNKVEYWYQQNIFLVAKKGYKFNLSVLEEYKDSFKIMDCVHPEIYRQKMETIRRIKSLNPRIYLNYLIKTVKQRLK
jgi:SAM-dependent methyltransferase